MTRINALSMVSWQGTAESDLETAMSGNVLISPNEPSDLMKVEPVVLIDTRDPAIYAEAHILGAVDVRFAVQKWCLFVLKQSGLELTDA